MTSSKLTILILTAALLAFPVGAQKVYVDFDDTIDFSQYKTFAFRDSAEDLRDSNQLGHTRVQNAIRRQMTGGDLGATAVLEDPDLWVTYHTSEKDEIRVNQTTVGMGYGSGWYGSRWRYGGYWGSPYGGSYTTSVSTYTKGTLVIDIWDAKREQMVWRGIATDVLPSSPSKRQKLLDKVLNEMSKKYHKQQKKNAKAART